VKLYFIYFKNIIGSGRFFAPSSHASKILVTYAAVKIVVSDEFS